MNVQVSQLQPIHCVMLRHVGPYEQIGGAFERLYAWLEQNGVPTQRTIGIYYDNPDFVEARALRSAACAEISAGTQVPDSGSLRLDVEDIAGGDYATTRYIGPYEQMAPVWTEFTEYIENTLGRAISERKPAFEVYVNDAATTPADQLITDLYMPLD